MKNITKLFVYDSKIISVTKGQTEIDKLKKDLDVVGN